MSMNEWKPIVMGRLVPLAGGGPDVSYGAPADLGAVLAALARIEERLKRIEGSCGGNCVCADG